MATVIFIGGGKGSTIGIDSHKSLTNIIENNTPCAGIKLTTLIA
jgi:hypothetical protein